MASTTNARDIFLSGLRNAHAMEREALAIMQPQLNRLEHYPQVSALLERHIRETDGQIERLDEIFASFDESPSMIKDATTSLGGSMAALGHTMAGDEILKNSFANYAFEHFEIAAYSSLITVAETAGAKSAITLLEQSLDEERRRAQAIENGLNAVTRQYLALSADDEHRADI